uniref:Reverse transcriptase domain-containing protein n=1 Tax=Tanacetum cinerariifolium TaxID=118510 RepID=A0A6L2P242_TANCI|nr:reverse transcriptase domain-containing protein [Tanacetum cinerariifolium]
MRTRSSSNVLGESSPNTTSLNPRRRNCRRSKQPYILEESPVDTMTDQRTMAELLRAPTEDYAECHAVDGNTFLEFRDNIQGYVSAAVVNYSQGTSSYRPPGVANQIEPPGPLPSNTIANPKGELKAITTRSGIVLDGPSIPMPHPFINPEEDERVDETLTDLELGILFTPISFILQGCTSKISKKNMKSKFKMLKALISNKEKLLELANTPLNENCSAVILKKLPKKLGDRGNFLILCSFSELKCKALAYPGASINLMPLFVWKKLGLPELISTRMTLKLANRAICTPVGITRDVFVPVGKFTFPADFVIVDYESDPRVLLILGDRKKEAIHLILTGIGDEIYSTVDACQTAQEMWEAIERLQQECKKPKMVKDFAYHKEKMLLCKQAEQGVTPQAEQYDWLVDTDEEVDEQELEAHYSYMAKIQEVPTADTGTDSEPVEQNDQNDVESDNERIVLANLKLDVDENKKI